jgi:hypothetical protein
MYDNCDDSRERLAKEAVDSMDMDELITFASEKLMEMYREFDEVFQQDWETLMDCEEKGH